MFHTFLSEIKFTNVTKLSSSTKIKQVLDIGEKNEKEKLSAHLKTLALNNRHQARNLGVIFDSDLNFETHIKNIIKTSFYHLRNIAKVQPFLAQADTKD